SSCPSSWVHGLYSFSWYGSVGAGQEFISSDSRFARAQERKTPIPEDSSLPVMESGKTSIDLKIRPKLTKGWAG
ncbi:hypothetical protein L2223_21955, partial [Xanthomonas perforans]|uniref:hypothetical protein n=1 Tax=Xanthomonas perforans TaxID=442694 RepID=UPI001F30A657